MVLYVLSPIFDINQLEFNAKKSNVFDVKYGYFGFMYYCFSFVIIARMLIKHCPPYVQHILYFATRLELMIQTIG